MNVFALCKKKGNSAMLLQSNFKSSNLTLWPNIFKEHKQHAHEEAGICIHR